MDDPLFEACRLFKKTSANGHTYLVGRMGGVRVLVMANRQRQGDDDATHTLLFSRATRREAAPKSEAPKSEAPPLRRPNGKSEGNRIEDDPLPF